MSMRVNERRWYPYVIAAGTAGVVLIWHFVERLNTPEFLVAGLAGTAATAHFFYQQHLETTRLFGELFSAFNRRYDRLNEKLRRILLSREAAALGETDKETLDDYFNLCAEEWFYFEAGYIDKRVWEAWLNGMAQFVRDEQIRDYWKSECRGGSYYRFPFESVTDRCRALLANG